MTRRIGIARSLLNHSGEVASAVAMLACGIAVPVRAWPSMTKGHTMFDMLGACFAMLGVLQMVAVVMDSKQGRRISAYAAALLWSGGVLIFLDIGFVIAVALALAMCVGNSLVAVRLKLRLSEANRMSKLVCERAGSCEDHAPPEES